MEKKTLRFTRLTLHNFMKFESLELALGPGMNVISGGNEEGKTTILRAFSSLIGGGHDARLLRNGADEGEIVLVLDNGMEFRKEFTKAKAELKASLPDVGRVSAAKTLLDRMVSGDFFNAARFVDPPNVTGEVAKRRERLDMLLGVLPVDVKDEEIEAIAHAAGTTLIDTRATGFARIEALRERLYKHRTETNRTAKDKRSTADELTRCLPPEAEMLVDWPKRISALEAEAKAQSAAYAERLAAEERAQADEREAAGKRHEARQKQFQDQIDGINAALDRQDLQAEAERQKAAQAITQRTDEAIAKLREEIASLEKKANSELEAIGRFTSDGAKARRGDAQAKEAKLRAELEAQRAEGARELEALRQGQGLRLDALKAEAGPGSPADKSVLEQLATARAKREEIVRAEENRKLRDRKAGEAKVLEDESERATKALEAVEALKGRVLKAVPIDGLAVEGGDILLDGVSYDMLSESKKWELSIRIAKLGLGDTPVPVVLCDGLERFDPGRLEALAETVNRLGVQVVGTRVTSGPFKAEEVK